MQIELITSEWTVSDTDTPDDSHNRGWLHTRAIIYTKYKKKKKRKTINWLLYTYFVLTMRVKIGKNSPSRGQIQSSIFLTAANIPGGPDEDSNFAVNKRRFGPAIPATMSPRADCRKNSRRIIAISQVDVEFLNEPLLGLRTRRQVIATREKKETTIEMIEIRTP